MLRGRNCHCHAQQTARLEPVRAHVLAPLQQRPCTTTAFRHTSSGLSSHWHPVTLRGYLAQCSAASSVASVDTLDLPALSPNEQSLAEQLQALLEISAEHGPQAGGLIQQMDLKLVTTSDAVNSPPTLITDTLADEAEDGGGDGMAGVAAVNASLPSSSAASRPISTASSSNSASGSKAAANNRSPGPTAGGGGLGVWGWGQSALKQLSARKAFANMYGFSLTTPPNMPQGAESRQPRFDPMDTLDDEEDADSDDEQVGADSDHEQAELYGGYEGGVLPLAQQPGQRLWPRPGKSTPDVGKFLGKVSSKIVSKVASKMGGLGKAAAARVARSVTNPIVKTSDAAGKAISKSVGKGAEVAGKAVAGAVAAVGASIPKSAKDAVSAAAANAASATASVKGAAAEAYAAAKSAPAKLMELGSGAKSTWMVVDSPAGGGMFPTAGHPVRVVTVVASPELTKLVRKMMQQQTTTGLVSFESYRLGVKVPGPVYSEASAMYQTLLPLIIDYVAENPKGRVCFTGEGVGGSLATVLGLMAASRGLRPHCMSPLVVAFNAPPVLAEVVSGALWGCGGAAQDACDTTDWNEMVADVTARGLLSELGLPPNAVLNVRSAAAVASAAAATATGLSASAGKAVGHAAGGGGGSSTAAQNSVATLAAAAATKLGTFVASSSGSSPTPASTASTSSSGPSTAGGQREPSTGPVIHYKASSSGKGAASGSASSGNSASSSMDEEALGFEAHSWQQPTAAGHAASSPARQITVPSSMHPGAAASAQVNGAAKEADGTHHELQLFKLVGEVRVLV